MLNLLKKTYHSLPIDKLTFLKDIPDELLYGRNYFQKLNNVTTSKKVIKPNLYNLLKYTKEHTQYGQEKIPSHFTVEDVEHLIKELPIINSTELNQNFEYYVSRNANRFNSYFTTTGGTGGAPASIQLSNSSYTDEWTHLNTIWGKVGYKKKSDVKLMLRGKHIDGKSLSKFNPIYNEVIVDSFRINQANFQQLINEISFFSPSYFHGYPSLAKEIMNYAIQNNYKFNFKCLFLGSEELNLELKKQLSDFFNCPILSWYGHSEKCILAECQPTDRDDHFRVYTSYGIPRVINIDETGFGELVGTSFINPAMPLINYSTGDFAKIIEDDDSIYIANPKGRWGKDFIYLTPDKKVSTCTINLHGDIQKFLTGYQIIQSQFGKIEIQLSPNSLYLGKIDSLENEFEKIMRNNLVGFDISVKAVNEKDLIRSHRGKLRMLVQNLKNLKDI